MIMPNLHDVIKLISINDNGIEKNNHFDDLVDVIDICGSSFCVLTNNGILFWIDNMNNKDFLWHDNANFSTQTET